MKSAFPKLEISYKDFIKLLSPMEKGKNLVFIIDRHPYIVYNRMLKLFDITKYHGSLEVINFPNLKLSFAKTLLSPQGENLKLVLEDGFIYEVQRGKVVKIGKEI